MKTRNLVTFILPAFAVLLAACYTVTEVVPLTSGIEGQVLLGPMCPVVREGTPCPDQPFQATVVIWDANRTKMLGRFISDDQGHFRVPFPPGDYLLEPEPPDPDKPFPTASPIEVNVTADAWTNVTIQYDTGIR